MQHFASIDIGSTYTKGALFGLEGERLSVLRYGKTATTVDHLKTGFDQVSQQLGMEAEWPVYWSSSARGGLSIVAIGLVPELTLKVARMAALSAGGKVAEVYAYKLTLDALHAIAQKNPDIILFAGGTDGGNETYVRHNLALLTQLPDLMAGRALPAVIYAGNSVLQREVQAALIQVGFDVSVAPNLMPQMEQVQPEGARERIREVFLQKIVHGKGLDDIIRHVGSQPLPTPLAMLHLVEALRNHTDFGDFLLIDMGGATTDVYSSGETPMGDDRIIKRGIKEPIVKRTVEGDLGMRVSARVASEAVKDLLDEWLSGAGQSPSDFARYIDHLMESPDHLPLTEPELTFDRALASACIHQAMLRHAGTWRRVFTASGETMVQTGKDLRGIRKLIGSGGFLSALPHFRPTVLPIVLGEAIPLVPSHFTYYRDRHYLLPLLGNLVASQGQPVLQLALESLEERGNV